MGIPGKGDSKMEQRDWELLDKQMRGLSPPRNFRAETGGRREFMPAKNTAASVKTIMASANANRVERCDGPATTRPNGAPSTKRQ